MVPARCASSGCYNGRTFAAKKRSLLTLWQFRTTIQKLSAHFPDSLRTSLLENSHAGPCKAPVKHLWIARPYASSAQNRSSESLVQPFTRLGQLFLPPKIKEKEDAQTVTPYRRSGHIGCCAARLGSVGLLGPARANAYACTRLLGFRS